MDIFLYISLKNEKSSHSSGRNLAENCIDWDRALFQNGSWERSTRWVLQALVVLSPQSGTTGADWNIKVRCEYKLIFYLYIPLTIQCHQNYSVHSTVGREARQIQFSNNHVKRRNFVSCSRLTSSKDFLTRYLAITRFVNNLIV